MKIGRSVALFGAALTFASACSSPEAGEPIEPVEPKPVVVDVTPTTLVPPTAMPELSEVNLIIENESSNLAEEVQCTELGRAFDDLGDIGTKLVVYVDAGNLEGEVLELDTASLVRDRLTASVVLAESPADSAELFTPTEDGIIKVIDLLGAAIGSYNTTHIVGKDGRKIMIASNDSSNERVDEARLEVAVVQENHCQKYLPEM